MLQLSIGQMMILEFFLQAKISEIEHCSPAIGKENLLKYVGWKIEAGGSKEQQLLGTEVFTVVVYAVAFAHREKLIQNGTSAPRRD